MDIFKKILGTSKNDQEVDSVHHEAVERPKRYQKRQKSVYDQDANLHNDHGDFPSDTTDEPIINVNMKSQFKGHEDVLTEEIRQNSKSFEGNNEVPDDLSEAAHYENSKETSDRRDRAEDIVNMDVSQNEEHLLVTDIEQQGEEPDLSQPVDHENINEILAKLQEKDQKIKRLENTIIEIENRKNRTISELQNEIEVLKNEKVQNKTAANESGPVDEKDEDVSSEEHLEESLRRFMQDGFNKIEKQVNQLKEEFVSKLKYDGSKERIIDKLHRELQTYKDDQIKDIVKPFINDLILMADRTKKLIEQFEQEEELYPKKLIRVIKDSAQDIEDILYRQGIESYNCDGDTFDVKRQQIVKMVKVDDPSKDKKVAEVVGNGYEWYGKVIRAEKVNIYLYEQSKKDK